MPAEDERSLFTIAPVLYVLPDLAEQLISDPQLDVRRRGRS
jgi:hypothetical protein